MDIAILTPQRIVAVARAARERPDTDLLCFGESDQLGSAAAAAAAAAALTSGDARYSDVRGLSTLRDALAAMLTRLHACEVAEERIQVTASGMTAVNVALAALVRAGDRVVIHTPAWPNIGNAVVLRQADVDALSLDADPEGRFSLDLGRLADKLVGARALVLNSPNNPTGWTATLAELTTILALCRRHGVWLIADEVYNRLVYDGAESAPSLLDITDPADRVVVCNSFSKTYAMTGWRLGWMVVPAGARDAVSEIVEVTHGGVAPFLQAGAIAALRDEPFVERFRSYCAAGRQRTVDALKGLSGVRFRAPDGAFYAFFGVDGLQDSLALSLSLVRDHGVAVAPGSAFGLAGEGHLRLCFAQAPDRIERALGRLRRGLQAR
ncbi:aminotransferase class I/II-fold pyridoxal phosphate-dependent enzyme [uncultured Enterovirga sp.]|uniref:aminotransferase class I/II-fold pyridoxal phosphate-dependent enzyme n=1 Tax=uncultured Enterovirga sp. TaxID=2026352 RepID=UPI0035CB711D